jgi:hypothetical protein
MVLDLFEQGKKRRDIASVCRMSFTDIKKIIDSKYGPKRQNNKLKNEKSKYSEALKLFLSGKKPVEVAITLALSYEEVRKIYLQFLKLNRMYRLRQIYDELGDNIKHYHCMIGCRKIISLSSKSLMPLTLLVRYPNFKKDMSLSIHRRLHWSQKDGSSLFQL